jgi:ribulose 1,5-bisphosphate synthetase/thiazole synthase
LVTAGARISIIATAVADGIVGTNTEFLGAAVKSAVVSIITELGLTDTLTFLSTDVLVRAAVPIVADGSGHEAEIGSVAIRRADKTKIHGPAGLPGVVTLVIDETGTRCHIETAGALLVAPRYLTFQTGRTGLGDTNALSLLITLIFKRAGVSIIAGYTYHAG